MKICVYGAGAIGGWLAVRLANAGHEVSVVARGEHLASIRREGLTLAVDDMRWPAEVRASDNPADLGPQDCVLVTLKAAGLDGFADAAQPLLGCDTSIIFTQNGLPWWYALGLPADKPTPPDLAFLDARPSLWPLSGRVIGGVVKSMVEVVAPGVVRNRTPAIDAIALGEPDDAETPRVATLRAIFDAAGVPSAPPASIRSAIWNKLLMNITGSVMYMLTGMTNRALHHDPRFANVLQTQREEMQAIGETAGYPIASLPPVSQRILSDHKPSILQDYERGRAVELDAIVIAPLAFARAAGVKTPTLDYHAALAVEKAMAAGLYEPRGPLPF